MALQQNPIVVEVVRQPEPTPDISLQTALGWFAMAGVLLLVAVVGSALVAGGIFWYKRRRDRGMKDGDPPYTHTRLEI